MPTVRPLTPIEARVLATLMEKARTVPDSYPLTLNSLLAGCNQKTSRTPVMNISEAEAQEALVDLRQLDLVIESSGGRTVRYEHNFQRAIGVPEQSATLLALLLLRGPQTAGELRLNAERWYRFADISSVEAFLDELSERSAEKGGPLVTRLPRAAGAREQRWAPLLCGPVPVDDPAPNPTDGTAVGDSGTLQQRIRNLEQQVERLQALIHDLYHQLGMALPAASVDGATTPAQPAPSPAQPG